MKTILLEEEYILEYIVDILQSSCTEKIEINRAKYHHNSSYCNSISIVKNGILSISELNRLQIKKYSVETIRLLDDTTCHINGKDGISLSVVGLNDIYLNEDEYNPFDEKQVDFLISDSISAYRNTTHYGNEFISLKKIVSDDIKAIDIRLLKYIQRILKDGNPNIQEIEDIINKYNCIINLSSLLEEKNNFITLREMSFESDTALDTSKLAKSPLLLIKNNRD